MKILWHSAWLVCFILFSSHQFTQKIMGWKIPWADNYLDCLLCMPIFLSFILVERRLIFRDKHYTFSFFETMVMTLVLGVVFEEGFSIWSPYFTRDYADYLAYFVGSVFFYFFINKQAEESEGAQTNS